MTFGFYPHWFSRRFTTMLAMATRSCRMIQRPSRHPSQPGPKVTSNWARCCWMKFSQQELYLKRQQAQLKAKKLWRRHLMVLWLQRKKRKSPKKLQWKKLNQRPQRSTKPSISSIKKIALTFKRSLTLKLPKREWTTHSMWLLFEEQVEGIAYNATIGFLYCVVWYRSSGCLKYNYTSYLPIPPDTKIQSNISGLWMREWRSA